MEEVGILAWGCATVSLRGAHIDCESRSVFGAVVGGVGAFWGCSKRQPRQIHIPARYDDADTLAFDIKLSLQQTS